MSLKIDNALALAAKGFRIFPLVHTLPDGSCSCGDPGCRSKGKHPIAGTNGWMDATLDPFEIMEFFNDNPDANYGVYPGTKFVIVDLDNKINKVNGIDSFEQRTGIKFFDAADETFTVQSPSGGFHLYYRTDEAFACATNVIPGIDIRAVGGYVVGPGSTIAGNEYTIVSDKDATGVPAVVVPILRRPRVREENANESLFELDTKPALKRASDFLSRRAPAVEGEGGDNHTYATFQLLKDIGLSLEKSLELMVVKGGWNDRCDPPWTFSELKRIGAHAWKYGKSAAGIKGGGSYEDMFGAPIGNPDWVQDEDEDPYASIRDIAFFGDELIKRGKRRDFVIPGWLPSHGYTCFLAERGVGKSTIMLDLALRIACDMDWHGTPIKAGTSVVYICGEDDTGSESAVKAWIENSNVAPEKDRFLFLAGSVDLMSMNSVKLWTEFLVKEFCKGRQVVLFVDTWQRASNRGSQNKDEDMQIAVAHVEAMCRSINGPGIIAFHPPKHNAGIIMGSSVIENSSSAIWSLTKTAVNRKLEVTRIKGEGFGNFSNFDFNVVTFDEVDSFGRPRTAVIPFKTGGTEISGVSKQQPEYTMNDIRATLAEVMRDMDVERIALNPESQPYTFEKLAIRICGSRRTDAESLISDAQELGSDGRPTDKAQFAKDCLYKLSSVGISVETNGWNEIDELLKQVFSNVDRYEFDPFDGGAGDVLTFERRGRSRTIKVN